MTVDGIWKIEVLAPYGWEAVSTAFLENGRYLGASQDHYVTGEYTLSGNQVRVVGVSHAHGESLNLFGASEKELELTFTGEVDGGQVDGQAEDKQGKYSITFRATRLADIP
jgi:hypothetical protein